MSVNRIIEELDNKSFIESRHEWNNIFKQELEKLGFNVKTGSLGFLKKGLVSVTVNTPGTNIDIKVEGRPTNFDNYNDIQVISNYYSKLERDLMVVNDILKKLKVLNKKYPYPTK